MPETQTEISLPFTLRYVTEEERRRLGEFNARVLERVRGMTPEEGFQSLVDAGIYTRDGQLAQPYR